MKSDFGLMVLWFHSEALGVSAPPSSLQLSEGSASLLCLLSGCSPQGVLVSWTVDGSEVKEGVLTSVEEEKNGCYSRSSTLTFSKALWEKGEEFGCTVSHDDVNQPIMFTKSGCEDQQLQDRAEHRAASTSSTVEFKLYTALMFLSLLCSLSCCCSCGSAELK
ncbi:hypothetical protein MHYP_G00170780 [Metynnis hypsauchen]